MQLMLLKAHTNKSLLIAQNELGQFYPDLCLFVVPRQTHLAWPKGHSCVLKRRRILHRGILGCAPANEYPNGRSSIVLKREDLFRPTFIDYWEWQETNWIYLSDPLPFFQSHEDIAFLTYRDYSTSPVFNEKTKFAMGETFQPHCRLFVAALLVKDGFKHNTLKIWGHQVKFNSLQHPVIPLWNSGKPYN